MRLSQKDERTQLITIYASNYDSRKFAFFAFFSRLLRQPQTFSVYSLGNYNTIFIVLLFVSFFTLITYTPEAHDEASIV